MTENLNQLREKQLLGVKYDYNEWSDVNYDYLLMSVIVNQPIIPPTIPESILTFLTIMPSSP
jgi:hypothetical protein